MKKLLLGTIGLVALSGSAMAADLPARTYKAPPPVVAPIYDWTGFYIGANGGWGESRNCWGIVPLARCDYSPTAAPVDQAASSAASSDTAGNPGSLSSVWKVRAIGRTSADPASASSIRSFSTGVKVDAVGLFTGQIGYAWNASLLYLKGGAATTRNRFDVWTTASGVNVATASSNRWGGTVGVGWEYGFAPNWSAGIEYDHLFMGDCEQFVLGRESAASRRSQPDQPGRGHGHPARQLPFRRLRRARSLRNTERDFRRNLERPAERLAFPLERMSAASRSIRQPAPARGLTYLKRVIASSRLNVRSIPNGAFHEEAGILLDACRSHAAGCCSCSSDHRHVSRHLRTVSRNGTCPIRRLLGLDERLVQPEERLRLR